MVDGTAAISVDDGAALVAFSRSNRVPGGGSGSAVVSETASSAVARTVLNNWILLSCP
jgi:hypothetical protein